jgi:serine protease inhibitor ecotin
VKAIIAAVLMALSVTTAGAAEDKDRTSANAMLPYCKAYIGETAQANPERLASARA